MRWLMLVAALSLSCRDVETPLKPPQRKPVISAPPAPPPPPDYSYAPVPAAIADVLRDPNATIDVLRLGSPAWVDERLNVVKVQRVEEAERDRIAVILMSGVTYGHLSNLCSSEGLAFRLTGARGAADVWVDPTEGRGKVIRDGKSEEFWLSESGMRLFGELQKKYSSAAPCGG